MKYEDIKLGDKASLEKVIIKEDVETFAKLSLDTNPIHLDPEYGKSSMFKNNIVHGMLVSSLISAVIGNQLPGNGTIYMGQDLKFLKPVYFADKCIAEVEVVKKRDDKRLIILDTIVYVDSKENIVIKGQAIVKKP